MTIFSDAFKLPVAEFQSANTIIIMSNYKTNKYYVVERIHL